MNYGRYVLQCRQAVSDGGGGGGVVMDRFIKLKDKKCRRTVRFGVTARRTLTALIKLKMVFKGNESDKKCHHSVSIGKTAQRTLHIYVQTELSF